MRLRTLRKMRRQRDRKTLKELWSELGLCQTRLAKSSNQTTIQVQISQVRGVAGLHKAEIQTKAKIQGKTHSRNKNFQIE